MRRITITMLIMTGSTEAGWAAAGARRCKEGRVNRGYPSRGSEKSEWVCGQGKGGKQVYLACREHGTDRRPEHLIVSTQACNNVSITPTSAKSTSKELQRAPKKGKVRKYKQDMLQTMCAVMTTAEETKLRARAVGWRKAAKPAGIPGSAPIAANKRERQWHRPRHQGPG
jgi:hypothetical protein